MNLWRNLPISDFESSGDWKSTCVSTLDDYITTTNDTEEIFAGLVNRQGQFVDVRDVKDVWGINVKVCYDFCGWQNLQTVFNFQVFSGGATNYLLPWLALTAQLPFETGEYNVIANVMSFCMALGSPMLITFSLMITILNQHWIRAKFREMEEADIGMRYTVRNARMFLQESQQVPLRLSQEDGSLASLIVLAENATWWERLRLSIMATRRGVTLSLVAQIVVAMLSWVLTVVAAFLSSLGNPSEALVLASGSLWIWLVPVICGWVSVGTQSDHSTITNALHRDTASIAKSSVSQDHSSNFRSRIFSTGTTSLRTVRTGSTDVDMIEGISPLSEKGTWETVEQRGTMAHSTSQKQNGIRLADQQHLLPQLENSSTGDATLQLDETMYPIPNCFGFSVAGDEKQEGPAFNYARVFTWWHVARQTHQAFEETVRNMDLRKDLTGRRRPKHEKFKHKDLRGDSLSLLQYCGLATTIESRVEPKDLREYPSWGEMDAAVWQRITIAAAMALFVQWGSTGAAIMIGYLTEVTGLGCRSGSYVVYGVNGTLSFALLFGSALFSHAAMLQHQEIQLRRRQYVDREETSASYLGSLTCYRVCAVVTRVLGRVLVVVNSIWIVLISLWELVGFFNNCWCDGVVLSRGSAGFVILFKTQQDMADVADRAWTGGVFVSVFVMAASSGVFWLFCRGNRK